MYALFDIEKLRTRPHDEKMAIAAGAGLVVALLLFFVWIVSWSPVLSAVPNSSVASVSQALGAAEDSELKAVFDTATESYARIEDIVSDIQAFESLPANPVFLETGEYGSVKVTQPTRASEGSLEP